MKMTPFLFAQLQKNIRGDATSQIAEHIKSNLHPKAYQIWMEQSPFDYPSKVSDFLDPFIARIFTEFMIPTENGDVDDISYNNGVLSITRINAEGNAEAKTSFSILNKALQGYLLSDEYSELVEKSNQFEREDRNTRLLWIGGGLASATALYFLLRKKK